MTDADLERQVSLLEDEVAKAERALVDLRERARIVAVEADAARNPRQFRDAVLGGGRWPELVAACAGFTGGVFAAALTIGLFAMWMFG